MDDRHPHCTGGIGLYGTLCTHAAMERCDALLIVGSRVEARRTALSSVFFPIFLLHPVAPRQRHFFTRRCQAAWLCGGA